MTNSYQWKPQPVIISGKRFRTKHDARFHVETLLRKHALDQPIEGDDKEFLLDLFRGNLKVNIARDKGWITTVTRSKHPNGTAVYVRRSGMPPIVCSWRQAIEDLRTAPPINDKKGDYENDRPNNLQT